jgi:hypothetical protein
MDDDPWDLVSLRSFGSFFVPPSYRTLDKTDFGASAEVITVYHKNGSVSIGFRGFFEIFSWFFEFLFGKDAMLDEGENKSYR